MSINGGSAPKPGHKLTSKMRRLLHLPHANTSQAGFQVHGIRRGAVDTQPLPKSSTRGSEEVFQQKGVNTPDVLEYDDPTWHDWSSLSALPAEGPALSQRCTQGPIRIVSASDGVDNNCAALLLNLRFVEGIRLAIEARWALADKIHTTEKQDRVAAKFRHRLEEKHEQYHFRLDSLTRKVAHASATEAFELKSEIEAIENKIKTLEVLQEEEIAEKQNRQIALMPRFQDLYKKLEVSTGFLESAFLDARLLLPHEDPPDTPVPSKNLEEEYRKLKSRTGVADQELKANLARRPAVRRAPKTNKTALVPSNDTPPNHQVDAPKPLPVPPQQHANAASFEKPSMERNRKSIDPKKNAKTADVQSAHREPQKTAIANGAADAPTNAVRGNAPKETKEDWHRTVPTSAVPLQSALKLSPVSKLKLQQEYEDAKTKLAWAQFEFDVREDTRREMARLVQPPNRVPGMQKEEFDTYWAAKVPKLLRKLIDTEEAFKMCEKSCSQGWVRDQGLV